MDIESAYNETRLYYLHIYFRRWNGHIPPNSWYQLTSPREVNTHNSNIDSSRDFVTLYRDWWTQCRLSHSFKSILIAVSYLYIGQVIMCEGWKGAKSFRVFETRLWTIVLPKRVGTSWRWTTVSFPWRTLLQVVSYSAVYHTTRKFSLRSNQIFCHAYKNS